MSDGDDPIQVLSELQPPTSTRWRDPAEVRRIARRRPRLRQAAIAGGVVIVATIAAVAIPHGAQHRTVDSATGLQVNDRVGSAVQLVAKAKPLTTTDAQAAAAVARTEQAFAISLLQHASAGSQNVVLSPSSLAIMLSMLQNGAAGPTRTEIANVLQTSGLSPEQQNAGWAALAADLTSAKGVTLESANSLWLQRGLKLRAAFMDALARYYRTGVWQVDFANDVPGATDAINSWTKQHTGGKITKLFNPGDIDSTTALVLANAVYFNAPWLRPFDPRQTRNGPFRLSNGSTVTVPFMSYQGELALSRTTDYQAVQLPYTGGRYDALAIMPTRQSLAQFVAGLTPEALTKIAHMKPSLESALELPKFTIATYTNLNRTLSAMGMASAFSTGADFGGLSATPMQVQSVVQRAYLQVDEKGTKAAGVTGGGLQATSMVQPLLLNRPFLFLVRDTKTGAIVFAAQIQNPAH